MRFSRRARAQGGDGQRRCVVDEQVEMLELLADRQDLVEVAAQQLALADLLRRDAGLLGENTRGELFGRHFQREEADHGAIGHLGLAVVAMLLAIGLHRVEGDVGGERGLSHRGTAGQDDEIGAMQAAQ